MSTSIGYTLYTTETTPYLIATRRLTGELVDFANTEMNTSAAWADAVLALAQNANHLGYPIDLSSYSDWMEYGIYDLCFYSQAGASPVITDTRFGRLVINYTRDDFSVIGEEGEHF